MPKYRFHLRDGVRIDDLDGKELPDLFEARLEAFRISEKILSKNRSAHWIDDDWKVIITDSENIALFILNLSAVFQPESAKLKALKRSSG